MKNIAIIIDPEGADALDLTEENHYIHDVIDFIQNSKEIDTVIIALYDDPYVTHGKIYKTLEETTFKGKQTLDAWWPEELDEDIEKIYLFGESYFQCVQVRELGIQSLRKNFPNAEILGIKNGFSDWFYIDLDLLPEWSKVEGDLYKLDEPFNHTINSMLSYLSKAEKAEWFNVFSSHESYYIALKYYIMKYKNLNKPLIDGGDEDVFEGK